MILLEITPALKIGAMIVGILIANGLLRLFNGNKDKSKPAKGLFASLGEKAFPDINKFDEEKKDNKDNK
jgi:hypothetical protein